MTPDALLDALDLAIAGDPKADAEIAALVADVRATAPQMTTEFAAALDARVRSGSAGDSDSPAKPRRARRAWFARPLVLAPAGAFAAAAAVAIVAIGSGGSSTHPSIFPEGKAQSFGPQAVSKATAPQAALAVPATPAPSAAATGSAGGGIATSETAPAPGHKVERSTTLELTTTTEKLQSVADRVVAITEQAGGFVASSQVDVDGETGAAQFTLRVPAAQSANALAAIIRLGHVASLSQATQDITGSFVSADTRLSTLRKRLRIALRQPQTPAEIAQEQALRSAIAAADRALSAVRHRADDVTIALTISAHRAHHTAAVHHHNGRWSPGHAAHVALRVLEVAAGVALVALAILAVVAPFALLGWLVARTTRRRGREAALDAS